MLSILDNKDTDAPSIFLPATLLREARRQKGLAAVDVPAICILDPDGDLARRLRQTGQSKPFEHWPCYHTQLDTFRLADRTVGIVGCAVGAPFAVLIAEELFACGCYRFGSRREPLNVRFAPRDGVIGRQLVDYRRIAASTCSALMTTRMVRSRRAEDRRAACVA